MTAKTRRLLNASMSAPVDGPKRLIIVGATGMVGGYALGFALDNSAVSSVTCGRGISDTTEFRAIGMHLPAFALRWAATGIRCFGGVQHRIPGLMQNAQKLRNGFPASPRSNLAIKVPRPSGCSFVVR